MRTSTTPGLGPAARARLHGISEEALADRRHPDDPSRFREAEIDEAVRTSRWRDQRRTDLWRSLLESAALMVFVALLTVGLVPIALALAALVAGPAVGALLHFAGAGRFQTGLWATLAFGLCVGPAAGLHPVGLLLFAPLVFSAFAVYGVRREFRAFAGRE